MRSLEPRYMSLCKYTRCTDASIVRERCSADIDCGAHTLRKWGSSILQGRGYYYDKDLELDSSDGHFPRYDQCRDEDVVE